MLNVLRRSVQGTRRRLVAASAALAGLAIIVAVPAIPWPAANASVTGTGHTTCAPSGSTGTTCTGTFSGDNAYDPNTGGQSTLAPTVTVNQTSNLTYQTIHVSWANFTPSVDPIFGRPHFYDVDVYECRGAVNAAGQVEPTQGPQLSWIDFTPQSDGSQLGLRYPPAVYQGTGEAGNNGIGSCYNAAIDKSGDTSWSGPANGGTYATLADGTGEATIPIETAFENKWLGCDQGHPCWLVVVPNWGGDWNGFSDPQGQQRPQCQVHDFDSDFTTDNGDDTRLGNLCSWPDRIMVPLNFAPTPTECPASPDAFTSEGAPVMARAMAQWRIGWCQGNNGLSFNYDGGINEYQARQAFLHGTGALTSSLDLALVTRPATTDQAAASSRKFTYAPLVNSSIAIAYVLDGATPDPDNPDGTPIRKQYFGLRLNARLVAKLLTQSYALQFADQCDAALTPAVFCDPAVAGNPTSIFVDPEFQALNPQFVGVDFAGDEQVKQGGFLPTVVAGNSDLVYELTRWVVADPSAEAFLAGQDDGHGMHVNTNYRGISYPLDQILAQDPGFTLPVHNSQGQDTDNWGMQASWFPKAGLANVAATIVAGKSTAVQYNGASTAPGLPPLHSTLPAQDVGARALFAVVSGADAAAFDLPTAELVNAAGQFVAPTTESMAAAVKGYQTNDDHVTQSANFANPDPKAYPLTVTSYAMVPTCGLPAAHAAAISRMLSDVSSTRQVYGVGAGQLGVGYLTLTAAQKAQAADAATKVSSADCAAAPAANPTPTTTGTPPPGGGGTPGGGSGTPNAGATPNSGANPSASAGVGHPTSSASTRAVGLGVTHPDAAGLLRYTLPVLLILGGALALTGPTTYVLGRTGAAPVLVHGARTAVGRLFRRRWS
jgi:PBP superfamily domain